MSFTNKVLGNILGNKPKADNKSRNMLESEKNIYYRYLKEMSNKDAILKDGRMSAIGQELEDKYPDETKELREAVGINKSTPW